MAVAQILDKNLQYINQKFIQGIETGKSLALGGASYTYEGQILLQSGGPHTINNAPQNEGFFVDPIRPTNSGDGLMNVIYDTSNSEFRLINGSGGGGGSSSGYNHSSDTSVVLGKGSSQTASNQIIIQSGTNTIDAPNQEGLFINPLRDIHSSSDNGSNPQSIYYDPDTNEVYFNTSLKTNNSTDKSLALGAAAASSADDQIILQSGDHTIQPDTNAGFYVDPVRSTTDGDGLMNVIYDTSNSEFRIIDGAGGGGGSSSGYNHSTSTSVAIGKGSSVTHDGQIILQSGSHTIDAPDNEGFFVDPIRNSNSASGFMDVRYHPSTSEFRVISGTESALIHESGTVRLPNLPTSDPNSAGQVYNDGGFLKISSG